MAGGSPVRVDHGREDEKALAPVGGTALQRRERGSTGMVQHDIVWYIVVWNVVYGMLCGTVYYTLKYLVVWYSMGTRCMRQQEGMLAVVLWRGALRPWASSSPVVWVRGVYPSLEVVAEAAAAAAPATAAGAAAAAAGSISLCASTTGSNFDRRHYCCYRLPSSLGRDIAPQGDSDADVAPHGGVRIIMCRGCARYEVLAV